MATLPELVTQALVDLRAAITSILGLETRMQAKFDASASNVTTIINNFNARPLSTMIYVDPARGDDANDGSSIALSRRSLDAVLASIGSQSVIVILFGDDTIRLRHNVGTNVGIVGAQRAATPSGYINFPRVLTILGIAENSPSPAVGTFCAGIFFNGGQLFTSNINPILQDVPAGYGTRSAFTSSAFVNMQFLATTILASGSGAGSLIGSFNGGRSVVTFESAILGSNAAGHVFDGVAAGADPNAVWRYSSNLKAA